jgi:hypothetical protein
VDEKVTNLYAPRVSALLLFVILTVSLTPGYAIQPFTYQYAFITITVTDYKITDPTHATVYGSIRNEGWFTVRLLSADGTVTTEDGTDLIAGDLFGLPVDVGPRSTVSAQATLLGYHTLAEFKQMNMRAIHVHAEGTYCFPTWVGCVGPFTHTYDRTFTIQEVMALAENYQILTASTNIADM